MLSVVRSEVGQSHRITSLGYPGSVKWQHFKPLNTAWGKKRSAIVTALPQIRVETLIGSQANYEIKIKITIYFYKIRMSYEKYSTLNYTNTKISKNSNLQLRITAGLISIREVAALFSPTRITYKLNKDTFISHNAVL